MTETAVPFGFVLEERVDRDLGCDQPFFSLYTGRRHRVRLAEAEELAAIRPTYPPVWLTYAAVTVRDRTRSRLFFTCTLELREDLTEEESKEIIRDLVAMQQAAAVVLEEVH